MVYRFTSAITLIFTSVPDDVKLQWYVRDEAKIQRYARKGVIIRGISKTS